MKRAFGSIAATRFFRFIEHRIDGLIAVLVPCSERQAGFRPCGQRREGKRQCWRGDSVRDGAVLVHVDEEGATLVERSFEKGATQTTDTLHGLRDGGKTTFFWTLVSYSF
jgi:hypothetical protein